MVKWKSWTPWESLIFLYNYYLLSAEHWSCSWFLRSNIYIWFYVEICDSKEWVECKVEEDNVYSIECFCTLLCCTSHDFLLYIFTPLVTSNMLRQIMLYNFIVFLSLRPFEWFVAELGLVLICRNRGSGKCWCGGMSKWIIVCTICMFVFIFITEGSNPRLALGSAPLRN